MTYSRNITMAIGAALLAGCSSSSDTPTTPPAGPAIGEAVKNTDGTYTVTFDGKTHDLPSPDASSGSTLLFHQWTQSPNEYAYGFETSGALAIGGMKYGTTDETFAGLSGTLAPNVPSMGTATYSSRAGVILQNDGPYSLTLDIVADFGAATVSGEFNPTGVDFQINGDIAGSEFAGTASFKGEFSSTATVVPMQGGFFGTDTIAGAFAGDGLAGAFGGTKQP